MDEETLIQRFLDRELGHAETLGLLRAVASRPELRERLIADEGLLDLAASLPRAEVPAGFVTRLTQALPAPQRPPRVATRLLRMSALAAAACLLMGVGFWAGRAGTPAVAPPAVVAEKDVLVRLVLLDPRAREVTVVGDFNDWDPRRTPLQKGESGVFHVTLPLRPGRYHYMYVVDGRDWRADPFAAENSLDGFGARNSVIDVEI